jgi:hypothetical protein
MKKQSEEKDEIITNGENNYLLDIKLKHMCIRDKLSIKHMKSRQENIERKENIICKFLIITVLLLRKRKTSNFPFYYESIATEAIANKQLERYLSNVLRVRH